MTSRSGKYFDEIIALIRSGKTGIEACKSNPDFPSYRSLTEWATKRGRKEEISKAWREREKSPAARMKTNLTYTEEQYDAAIELLTRNPRKSLRQQAKALSVDLPSRETIYLRKRRDPEFAARFAEATKNIRSVVSRHAPSVPKPVYRSNLLRRALLQHPVWLAAKRAVPAGTACTEDVIQEICLAVIEGTITAEEIAKRGNKLGYERLRRHVFASLDAPTRIQNRESERGTLVDTIANENGIVFY
mgnify:CR=1 FL=1